MLWRVTTMINNEFHICIMYGTGKLIYDKGKIKEIKKCLICGLESETVVCDPSKCMGGNTE